MKYHIKTGEQCIHVDGGELSAESTHRSFEILDSVDKCKRIEWKIAALAKDTQSKKRGIDTEEWK